MLPRTYSDGDCAVVIDIDSDRAVDRFPFELMKDAAWTIASNCVAGEKSARLGGKGLVGPKEIVSVTVFGIRVRAGD